MKDLKFKTEYSGTMTGPQGAGFGSVHTARVNGAEYRGGVKVWSASAAGAEAAEALLAKLGGGR